MQLKRENNQIKNAVLSGIEEIVKEHPRFENFQPFLIKHIDEKKLQDKYSELISEAHKKNMTQKEGDAYISKGISDYVASGSVLDEKGKQVILKNGLEEKSKNIFQKLLNKPKFDGEKYLDNTMGAFQDLYALFKSGDYSARMPELTKSVTKLYDLNFLDPAIDVLKAYGLIDKRKHEFLKTQVYKKTGEESKKVVSGIEKYIVAAPEKIAASVIGFFGFALIALNLTITGKVVGGTLSNPSTGIIGLAMIFLALGVLIKKKKEPLKTKRYIHNNKRW